MWLPVKNKGGHTFWRHSESGEMRWDDPTAVGLNSSLDVDDHDDDNNGLDAGGGWVLYTYWYIHRYSNSA